MALPIRTTIEDVQEVCTYLSKKPTGATLKEAKAVLDGKHLDGRKLSALRFWGLIEGDERMKLTTRGREAVRDHGARQAAVLAEAIRGIEPYRAIVERAAHRGEKALTAVEVAAHWHEHFKGEVSSNEKILNDQAVCFFQLASGAGLGELVVGRRGSPTRFEFDLEAAAIFVDLRGAPIERPAQEEDSNGAMEDELDDSGESAAPAEPPLGQGIFIAHGKNKKPLEQLKRILDQFKVPYRVAVEEPNLGRPIGEKVREIMQSCNCAILIFTTDEEFTEKEGNTVWRPSENVVYELGASGYLYGDRIVILKEDGVDFPANFRDIGYISFKKDQLEAKSMDLLKELIGFGILKVST
jgi:predicted nucleotide-binding protein